MTDLIVRNLFRLANGVTVLAVDRPAKPVAWRNLRVKITGAAHQQRQPFTVVGESLMFGRSTHSDQVAVETVEPVHLSPEEAQSGTWRIAVS